MAELTHKERLQPSLLDRLTDEAPDVKVESREARVISGMRLREHVKRDLGWLFNTTALDAVEPLDDLPFVSHSVLNYGMPDLAGKPLSSIDLVTLEKRMLQTILDFEPRLKASSVRVSLTIDRTLMSHNALIFDIEADLWAQPIPLRLFLRTQLDLESGNVDVRELTPER